MFRQVSCELNLLCVLVLALVLHFIRTGRDQQSSSKAFVRVVRATIAMLLLDFVWVATDGLPGSFFTVLNYTVNALYLFTSGLVAYFWYLYIQRWYSPTRESSVAVKHLQQLPLMVLLVFCAATPFTKWMFYLDEANVYHRAAWHFMQIAISYLYLAMAFVMLILALRRATSRPEKLRLIALLHFFLLPAVGGIVSGAISGMPALWPATAFALLLIFMTQQQQQISTDGLTELNNRRRFDQYLHDLLRDNRHGMTVSLMMIDINGFKAINDTYGHAEGDVALRETAALLSSACQEQNLFLARYGGDEFVIILPQSTEAQLSELKTSLMESFDARNKRTDRPYQLTLSLGVSTTQIDAHTSATHLVDEADEALYKDKNHKR